MDSGKFRDLGVGVSDRQVGVQPLDGHLGSPLSQFLG